MLGYQPTVYNLLISHWMMVPCSCATEPLLGKLCSCITSSDWSSWPKLTAVRLCTTSGHLGETVSILAVLFYTKQHSHIYVSVSCALLFPTPPPIDPSFIFIFSHPLLPSAPSQPHSQPHSQPPSQPTATASNLSWASSRFLLDVLLPYPSSASPRPLLDPSSVPPRSLLGPSSVPPQSLLGPFSVPPRYHLGPSSVPPRSLLGTSSIPSRILCLTYQPGCSLQQSVFFWFS